MRGNTPEEIGLLNKLYGRLRLYTNYFQPTMKLIEKVRVGSRVTKRYDQPKTPYQRVLDSPDVPLEKKESLRKAYQSLDLAGLKREMERIQKALEEQGVAKRGALPHQKSTQAGYRCLMNKSTTHYNRHYAA